MKIISTECRLSIIHLGGKQLSSSLNEYNTNRIHNRQKNVKLQCMERQTSREDYGLKGAAGTIIIVISTKAIAIQPSPPFLSLLF